ncbi:hypothetical protein BWI93_16520 [Siphonobacter sp. BAB-5385]|uniref:hypothetical protein n=1 Tax=Siphonobacter sp. BAB-5385 TaxID=1864822 RepID=UPI000B9E34BE|nr:hypothetical protein [Siphonobacter sp. BAB-5385]OZI07100.1 hypothetical protein BWI93_16520 [Siphonobacter sp. BAB-5385]
MSALNVRAVSADVYRNTRVVWTQVLQRPPLLPAFVPVASYADLVALPDPLEETFYAVASDEQNNDGNPSKYSKQSDGSIWWWAAQKMN